MNKTTGGLKFNTGRDPSPGTQYGNLVRSSQIRYNPDLQKEVPLRVPLDMEYAKETRKQANILFKQEMIKKVEEYQIKKENDL